VRIDVFTVFPELVEQYASAALIGRARAANVLDLRVHDLRSGSTDRHRSVDDAPFGGGPGMVLAVGPILRTVQAAEPCRPLFLLGPGGRRLDQRLVEELARLATRPTRGPGGRPHGSGLETAGVGATAGGSRAGGFSLLCGRYEGVDQRVADHVVDGEISVGDYVLAGGELAALVVVEAVTRLLPGAMGNQGSTSDESFSDGLLEYPQYTRPAQIDRWSVPPVLLSGDHARVARWRHGEALRRTIERRPDLIAARGGLQPEERALLEELDDLRGAPASASNRGWWAADGTGETGGAGGVGEADRLDPDGRENRS